jgi:hypothetical protein
MMVQGTYPPHTHEEAGCYPTPSTNWAPVLFVIQESMKTLSFFHLQNFMRAFFKKSSL